MRPQLKQMAADIRSRPDLIERLPRLIAYALHQDQFFPTLNAAEGLVSNNLKKVLLKGLTLYARESPWPDQVDFVVKRLLPPDIMRDPKIKALITRAKACPPDSSRAEMQRALVRKARLTEQARAFQIAVLKDIGWAETARWLGGQPFAASRGQSRPIYSPDEIKALRLPRLDGSSRDPKRKKKSSPVTRKPGTVESVATQKTAATDSNATAPLPAPMILESGGALVTFDANIFANIRHRIENSTWRVISADTYFLAEALSVHQRWVIAFPGPIRVSTSLVIDRIEIRVQPKGLVADMTSNGRFVERINFQRSLIRTHSPIPDGAKQSIGLILLYIFNANRKLRKSNTVEDLLLADEVATQHFPISSVYRVKTASSMADIGAHSRVRGNSNQSDSKRHDVRGHTRRVRGVDYQVKAHQRGT